LLVASALLVATACSGTGGNEPVRVAPRDVPFGLVDEPRPELDRPTETRTVQLYYLSDDRLVRIERPSVTEPTARRVLGGLLAGPTESEQAFGTTSALPSPASARLVHVRENVARVELAPAFRDGAVANQSTALGQIVFTLTALPGIDEVSFVVEGSPVSVPTAAGTLVEGPVGRRPYQSLLDGPATDSR
jgi:spore germination protein GerM